MEDTGPVTSIMILSVRFVLTPGGETLNLLILSFQHGRQSDGRHGTSDEYHDPFCEVCSDNRRRNVQLINPVHFSMADSQDRRHGTSDEYHDLFCEVCSDTRRRNVKLINPIISA